MPTSVQGIGTTYYGQRDFEPDGSFITTEWVIFGGIPLLPLRSLRVCYQGAEGSVFPIVHSEEKYLVLAKMSVNWKQVSFTYGFILFLIAWVVLLTASYGFLTRHFGETGAGVVLFIALVPGGIVACRIKALCQTKATRLTMSREPTDDHVFRSSSRFTSRSGLWLSSRC